MYKNALHLITKGLKKRVPATGLGFFRIGFGLLTVHEVGFLFYFRHLIFDPIPFLDQAPPLLSFFLVLWGIAALNLTVGWFTRLAALVTYSFWLLFLGFTPMWQDFDGGFDQLMVAGTLFLVFLPSERSLSLDNLRLKLTNPNLENRQTPPVTVSVLSYFIPLGFCLGNLYFDSAIHKLSAEFWRNGLGAWLPSTMPYYISAIDMSPLLNLKHLQMVIGYSLFVFQFGFLFFFGFRRFRVPLMVIGVIFHTGITVSLNIYPFGIGMLVFYFLMVPFSWWRYLKKMIRLKSPLLTVIYNQDSIQHKRMVITVRHFDVLGAIEFKEFQEHVRQYPALTRISGERLLNNPCAINRKGQQYEGINAYIQILLKMRYTAAIGLIMGLPKIHSLCDRHYRQIRDSRSEMINYVIDINSDNTKIVIEERLKNSFTQHTGTVRQRAHRIMKILVVLLFLQLNSTIHYGIVHRLGFDRHATATRRLLTDISNSILLFSHAFLGITPHGLYLHDHFEGFNHLFAFTYMDNQGQEKFLPFVNEEGRIVAPNWGRIQSMWANVAVMADVKRLRFRKFSEKVTAFWGTKVGIDLSNAVLTLKMKEIQTPVEWEKNLRYNNIVQPWVDIGTVIWKDGAMRLDIPEVDIEKF